MVQINVVDLSEFGVRLPADKVTMAIAQPFLGEDMLTSQEPYRVATEAIERQLDIVNTTIDISCQRQADFTIIPEYSVPGLEGVALIEKRLGSDAWHPGAILIGGIDGLNKEEYVSLVEADHTFLDAANEKESVDNDEWVNCCITWVKSSDGKLLRWVQPKLRPSGPEQGTQHQWMFEGKSMFLFRGRRANEEVFTFATMICFDWIAPTNPTPGLRLLAEAHRSAGESQIPISWVFVIQHNEKPSHFEFLNGIVDFFRDRLHPNATRNDTCLVFANTAGRGDPGSCGTHGTSGLVLSPRAPITTKGGLPTFAHDGRRYRRENGSILFGVRCKDVVLRESGECIHSFDQINPSWVQPGAAGRSYAVENASVHAARGENRILAPGSAVAAALKWVNDQLDNFDGTMPVHAAELEEELVSTGDAVETALRSGDSRDLDEVVRLATPDSSEDPDEWSDSQEDGLSHVVRSLQILAMGAELVSVGVNKVHGVVAWKGQRFDVMAVRGTTHQACIDHVRAEYGRRQRRHLVLVTRDNDNTRKDRREENILRARKPASGKERRYTEGRNPSFHLGYQNITEILASAAKSNDIAEQVYASC